MIRVGTSKINGKGLFATRRIARGEVVISWDQTRELSKKEYESLPSEDLKYIDIKDGRIYLVGEPERFVNHSCDPNTVPGSFSDVAGRDIEMEEEITANYRLFSNPNRSFICQCRSPICTKKLV